MNDINELKDEVSVLKDDVVSTVTDSASQVQVTLNDVKDEVSTTANEIQNTVKASTDLTSVE